MFIAVKAGITCSKLTPCFSVSVVNFEHVIAAWGKRIRSHPNKEIITAIFNKMFDKWAGFCSDCVRN